MPVSDEMKQFVYNDVKDAFYKYNGMSGDNEAEQKRYSAAINNYLKTIKKLPDSLAVISYMHDKIPPKSDFHIQPFCLS